MLANKEGQKSLAKQTKTHYVALLHHPSPLAAVQKLVDRVGQHLHLEAEVDEDEGEVGEDGEQVLALKVGEGGGGVPVYGLGQTEQFVPLLQQPLPPGGAGVWTKSTRKVLQLPGGEGVETESRRKSLVLVPMPSGMSSVVIT